MNFIRFWNLLGITFENETLCALETLSDIL